MSGTQTFVPENEQNAPAIKLSYAFDSAPNPIRVSAPGTNPSIADLLVTISNANPFSVTFTKIRIEVPVGANDAARLSVAPNLPAPTHITKGWQAGSDGSFITIKPAGGGSGKLAGDAITFVVPGIAINEVPSAAVPITITEFYPDNSQASDPDTYALIKERSELLVKRFHATPDTLNDLDQTAQLFWEVTEDGKQYTYRLRADDARKWMPRDCLADGNCFTWQDGIAGVQTQPLVPAQGTSVVTFKLDVIQANVAGNRVVYQTLQTQVQIGTPSITSYKLPEHSRGGRIVRLHWVAINTAYCSIQLDDETILAERAPADTYESGYVVFLPGAPGVRHITVIAHAQAGGAVDSHSFPGISVKPSVIAEGRGAQDIAITPDASLAIVGNSEDENVTVINLKTLKPEPNRIKIGRMPWSIAIAPDGKLALITSDADDLVSFLDIASRNVEATISMHFPSGIAITPDGAFALVLRDFQDEITVIDVANRKVDGTIKCSGYLAGIAITPDGALAFVTNDKDHSVVVIDVPARKMRTSVKTGTNPALPAITPDGALVFVPNMGENTVSVIDVRTLTVKATLTVGPQPINVTISRDGKLAFVSVFNAASLVAIDIATLTVNPVAIPVGAGPKGVVFTPDLMLGLVANYNDNNVSII